MGLAKVNELRCGECQSRKETHGPLVPDVVGFAARCATANPRSDPTGGPGVPEGFYYLLSRSRVTRGRVLHCNNG